MNPTFSSLDEERMKFMKQYKDCFSEALPGVLPPKRPEDHAILEIPGTSPPNRAPYRVSAAQQEEINEPSQRAIGEGTDSTEFVALLLTDFVGSK